MGNPPKRAELSAIVGAIYDCVLDPAGWDGTLDRMREVFNAHNAILHMVDVHSQRLIRMNSVGIEPVWLERQALHAEEIASWTLLPETLNLPTYEPQIMSRHAPAGFRATSRYHREWVVPQGLTDGMNLILENNTGLFAAVGLGRHEQHGPFEERDIRLARLLSPHLRRAANVSRILDRTAAESEMTRATLDMLSVGVVISGSNGRILHANHAAESMFRQATAITAAGGTLYARQAAATAELHAAIDLAGRDEVALARTGVAVRVTEAGAPPAVAHVVPIRDRTEEANAVAAVFVNATPHNGVEAMAVAYDLTPSESRVLAALLAGRTLAQAAALLTISENTAKRHLQNVFAKTGASRQAELVRLAASMVSPAHKSS